MIPSGPRTGCPRRVKQRYIVNVLGIVVFGVIPMILYAVVNLHSEIPESYASSSTRARLEREQRVVFLMNALSRIDQETLLSQKSLFLDKLKLEVKVTEDQPILQFFAFVVDFVLSAVAKQHEVVPITSLNYRKQSDGKDNLIALSERIGGISKVPLEVCLNSCDDPTFDPLLDIEVCYVKGFSKHLRFPIANLDQTRLLQFVLGFATPESCFIVPNREIEGLVTLVVTDFKEHSTFATQNLAELCKWANVVGRDLEHISHLVRTFLRRDSLSSKLKGILKTYDMDFESMFFKLESHLVRIQQALPSECSFLTDGEDEMADAQET